MINSSFVPALSFYLVIHSSILHHQTFLWFVPYVPAIPYLPQDKMDVNHRHYCCYHHHHYDRHHHHHSSGSSYSSLFGH